MSNSHLGILIRLLWMSCEPGGPFVLLSSLAPLLPSFFGSKKHSAGWCYWEARTSSSEERRKEEKGGKEEEWVGEGRRAGEREEKEQEGEFKSSTPKHARTVLHTSLWVHFRMQPGMGISGSEHCSKYACSSVPWRVSAKAPSTTYRPFRKRRFTSELFWSSIIFQPPPPIKVCGVANAILTKFVLKQILLTFMDCSALLGLGWRWQPSLHWLGGRQIWSSV